MNTRLATAFSRHTLLAAVAMLSASAALLSAQPAAAAQGSVDPYTQGAVAKADPYTDGAAKFDVYTQAPPPRPIRTRRARTARPIPTVICRGAATCPIRATPRVPDLFARSIRASAKEPWV